MESAVARDIEPTGQLETPSPGTIVRIGPTTSFLGREQEIAAVLALLDAGNRLVTITGPGGVGKTRLALAVLSAVGSAGAGRDLAFISLAPVADESLVIPTVARSLGVVAEDERTPVERLTTALRHRPLLLVLDNLEHVIGSAVELSHLLAACPELVLLTTSRRALRLMGEQEFPLAPLPVGSVDRVRSLAELADSPAVKLFVDRASAANPSFALTDANAPAVAQICARLDGLPLAIELAAARVKLMSPQALLARLSGRLQLLTTGPRDVPTRQQTLRDAIAWSYDLLRPEEQSLFRRMAVFAGGATLDAIEAVAGEGVSGLGRTDEGVLPSALDVTAGLVEHSLVVQEEGAEGESRFRMLETIREFAFERLVAEDGAGATRDAHARHYLALSERAANPEYTIEESTLIQQLEPELDNIRAALTWLLGDVEFDSERAWLGLRLAGSMVRFWDIRGFLQEEGEWLRRSLAAVPDAVTPEHGTAYTALGVNAWFSGDLDAAVQWQTRALDVWKALDDRRFVVRSLWFLGLVAGMRGEVERLETLSAEARPLAPHIGVTLWQVVPDSLLALAALAQGDGKRARVLLQSTLDFHASHDYLWPHAWVLGLIAEASLLEGDRVGALKAHQQSLTEFNEHGDIYATLDGLAAVATHATELKQAEIAARLLGTIASIRPAIGSRMTWNSVSEEDAAAAARAALGEAVFQAEFGRGAAMSLPEAVALAISVAPNAARHAVEIPREPDEFNLSPRERDVLKLLTEGKSNDEIGEALFISPRTASTHVANILGKMGVSSRAGAVAIALKRGLV